MPAATPDHRPSAAPAGAATVVLVHGAWHGAWCFAALQAELDRRGIPSLAVDLPGHGASTLPLGTLDDDIAHVRRVLDALTASAGPGAVVVGHSYGGAVVAAATAGRDDVAAVVFLCAYAPVAGESIDDIVRAHPGDSALSAAIRVHADGTATLDRGSAAAVLYGECDDAVVAAAVARLGPQSIASFRHRIGESVLGALPTTYVRCTRDRCVPLEQQDAVAARCDHVVTLPADHSPFLSVTVETADVVADVVAAATPTEVR